MLTNSRQNVLRLLAQRYDLLENVSPREFEFLVARLLQEKGFQTIITPASRDGGKDIIATKDRDGKEYLLLVECKKWIADNVGIDIIQRAFGIKYINNADEFMIVTSARFTQPAIKEAEKKTTELSLVDSNALRNWLSDFDKRMKLTDQFNRVTVFGGVRIDMSIVDALY